MSTKNPYKQSFTKTPLSDFVSEGVRLSSNQEIEDAVLLVAWRFALNAAGLREIAV